jgi:hypothetical protein
MRVKKVSAAALARLLVVMAGGMLLAGCGASSTGTFIPLPVVTISPATASVQAGAPLQFSATVVSPTSTTITWAVNNILGGNSTLGTVSSTGLYTAPVAVPTPPTVTVTATSSAETHPFGSALVTITPPPASTAVTIAPLDTATPAGTSVQFAASVSGAADTAVTWLVNGVAGGNSTLGMISSSGLYQAPTTLPSPPTVVVTATSQVDTSQSASATVEVTAGNTAPLYVNLGPNGNTGNPDTTYYNGLFTTVSVCLPSTPNCQIISDILVDTGSVGLRVLNSALTAVPADELGTIKDSEGNQVMECVQFGDTSYAWGPILYAQVQISGETATSVPIQVIGDTTFPVPAASCLTLGSGPSLDTVAALGANGILGVGTSVQDCGLNCAAGQTFLGYPYYVCPLNVCQPEPLPVTQQVANPIAFFAKDNNGVEIILPSISSSGAPSLPFTNPDGTGLIPAGQLVFGVGTESNNALGSATLYALDAHGNFPNIIYQSETFSSDSFLDTGSNALYISDAHSLGIVNCSDNPYYCPSSPLTLILTPEGANGTSGTVTLEIANADDLIATSAAAFNNLGGASGDGLSTDYFDLGLPFFFGQSVFVGIAGTTVPGSVSAPNGYYAF